MFSKQGLCGRFLYNTGDHDTMDMLVKELKTNRTIIELDKSAASKPRVLESCLESHNFNLQLHCPRFMSTPANHTGCAKYESASKHASGNENAHDFIQDVMIEAGFRAKPDLRKTKLPKLQPSLWGNVFYTDVRNSYLLSDTHQL